MTNNDKKNIYNAIQNLYNMDFTSWQEVLAMMYNLVSDTTQKFDVFEQRFIVLLGAEVSKAIKELYDNGQLADIINKEIVKNLDFKIETLTKNVYEQLDKKASRGIDEWIKHNNKDKSIYIAGDSTSDDTIPYYENSPTKCLYDRLQKVGLGEGFPLEGVKLNNGFATSGCTAKDYLNGTAPATERNLSKLLNALKKDNKYKLVILSLGLNNSGDETLASKYDSMTKIINKILEIENTFILLRMPNSIADTDDLTHSNKMRDLYIKLDKDNHPRTAMLNTQKLLWGEQAGFIPTRGYYTNTNYPQWCIIVEGGKAWKPSTYGTSGSVKPNFSQGNKGDTLQDGTVTWTCLGKGTDLFLNSYHPSQKGFEKLADLLIEVLTDKSRISDDKFKNDIYDCYIDTNPLFDVYKGVFIVSGDYEGIVNKIEKGDIIQVGNNYSELGKIKNIYNPKYHDISNNNITYGQYVFINGYTWRCVYYGTADFANFPSLDNTLNINKTVFLCGSATFALECKGKIIEVDADGVTTGNTIVGAYRKRLRLIKKKSTENEKWLIYRGVVNSGNFEIDNMFKEAGFSIEIKTNASLKEDFCLGFLGGNFYLYKDSSSHNSISKAFNYMNGKHIIEKASWSDTDFEACLYIKDFTKIDVSKITSRYKFSSNTFVDIIGKEKSLEEHLRYLYSAM